MNTKITQILLVSLCLVKLTGCERPNSSATTTNNQMSKKGGFPPPLSQEEKDRLAQLENERLAAKAAADKAKAEKIEQDRIEQERLAQIAAMAEADRIEKEKVAKLAQEEALKKEQEKQKNIDIATKITTLRAQQSFKKAQVGTNWSQKKSYDTTSLGDLLLDRKILWNDNNEKTLENFTLAVESKYNVLKKDSEIKEISPEENNNVFYDYLEKNNHLMSIASLPASDFAYQELENYLTFASKNAAKKIREQNIMTMLLKERKFSAVNGASINEDKRKLAQIVNMVIDKGGIASIPFDKLDTLLALVGKDEFFNRFDTASSEELDLLINRLVFKTSLSDQSKEVLEKALITNKTTAIGELSAFVSLIDNKTNDLLKNQMMIKLAGHLAFADKLNVDSKIISYLLNLKDQNTKDSLILALKNKPFSYSILSKLTVNEILNTDKNLQLALELLNQMDDVTKINQEDFQTAFANLFGSKNGWENYHYNSHRKNLINKFVELGANVPREIFDKDIDTLLTNFSHNKDVMLRLFNNEKILTKFLNKKDKSDEAVDALKEFAQGFSNGEKATLFLKDIMNTTLAEDTKKTIVLSLINQAALITDIQKENDFKWALDLLNKDQLLKNFLFTIKKRKILFSWALDNFNKDGVKEALITTVNNDKSALNLLADILINQNKFIELLKSPSDYGFSHEDLLAFDYDMPSEIDTRRINPTQKSSLLMLFWFTRIDKFKLTRKNIYDKITSEMLLKNYNIAQIANNFLPYFTDEDQWRSYLKPFFKFITNDTDVDITNSVSIPFGTFAVRLPIINAVKATKTQLNDSDKERVKAALSSKNIPDLFFDLLIFLDKERTEDLLAYIETLPQNLQDNFEKYKEAFIIK